MYRRCLIIPKKTEPGCLPRILLRRPVDSLLFSFCRFVPERPSFFGVWVFDYPVRFEGFMAFW